MKRILRYVLDFLERKFPDKVVVTDVKFKELDAHIVIAHTRLDAIEEKLKTLEANLLNVNQAMGFAGPKMGMLER